MSDSSFALLPPLRRVVTTHDSQGNSTVADDTSLIPEPMAAVSGAQATVIWTTTDGLPVNDNNQTDDGAKRVIDDSKNFGLLPPTGTSLRMTDLPPGAVTPMHRTTSLDHNILISGELILITDDGVETHLKNPGDTVVQRGTMHAWRNPSPKKPTRWISVLIAAEAALVNGNSLGPSFIPTEPHVQ